MIMHRRKLHHLKLLHRLLTKTILKSMAMLNYTLPFEKRGSMVDSWVRKGTRAVPSQCSGPPVSFSVGPGIKPGTLCDSPHVSNHLANWAGHER